MPGLPKRLQALDRHLRDQNREVLKPVGRWSPMAPMPAEPGVCRWCSGPLKALLESENALMQIYSDVQLALRETVAERTLDALVTEKVTLGKKVLEALMQEVSAYGLELKDVGIKDVVMPGDIKAQYVRVIEARKRSEAAQIERRGEVAATRSLANTAQLLEKNPTLFKLKALESLERIARGGAKVILPADFLVDRKE